MTRSQTSFLGRRALMLLSCSGALVLCAAPLASQVKRELVLASSQNGMSPLADLDLFGFAMSSLGDRDLDGVPELAVGAPGDDDDGAVYVLFPDVTGAARTVHRIDGKSLGIELEGRSLEGTLDIDGDGFNDLLVGAPFSSTTGALHVLFLTAEGLVDRHHTIEPGSAGFGGAALNAGDEFGSSVAALGDLDGDGTVEVAVGAAGACPFLSGCGAVWILSLDSAGQVAGEVEIADGSFVGGLGGTDRFGSSVAAVGDVNADGVPDLAVGAPGDSGGVGFGGAVWLLFLDTGGRVIDQQRIASDEGGLVGPLENGDFFGRSLAPLGDLEGNGAPDLAVGAIGDDDGAAGTGAVWILFLEQDGTVRAEQKISATVGGLKAPPAAGQGFAEGLGSPGDVDGDGVGDLLVGAPRTSSSRGATWVLALDPMAPSSSVVRNTMANPEGFHETSPPVIGRVWSTTVDLATPGALVSVVAVSGVGPATMSTAYGDLLVDLSSGAMGAIDLAAGVHSIVIPNDASLIGVKLWTQAGTIASAGQLELDNALDLIVGSF